MSGFADAVQVDLIVNGRPDGQLARDVTNGRYAREPKVGFDEGFLRPVIMTDNKRYCLVKSGRMVVNKDTGPDKGSFNPNRPAGSMVPQRKYIPLQRLINNGMAPMVFNSSALPHETWQMIDRAVLEASRDELNAWNDLNAANPFGGFDGMSVTGLVKDTMTDPGDAVVDMDTLTDDINDAPLFTPDILPLPIIHAGAFIPQRRLAMSRNSGQPLDMIGIETSARRCNETLEKMTIGMLDFSGLKIGQSHVPSFTNQGIYGFKTQPDVITGSITATGSWTDGGSVFVNEVIELIEAARLQKFKGPFVLYYSTSYDQFLARDYFIKAGTDYAAAPTMTVRQRVEQIPGIQRLALLDLFTTADELILVQMTSKTVRAVTGMEFTPVQWTEDGGAKNMLRVMGIKVPDLRSQYVGQSTTSRKCGIVYAT